MVVPNACDWEVLSERSVVWMLELQSRPLASQSPQLSPAQRHAQLTRILTASAAASRLDANAAEALCSPRRSVGIRSMSVHRQRHGKPLVDAPHRPSRATVAALAHELLATGPTSGTGRCRSRKPCAAWAQRTYCALEKPGHGAPRMRQAAPAPTNFS